MYMCSLHNLSNLLWNILVLLLHRHLLRYVKMTFKNIMVKMKLWYEKQIPATPFFWKMCCYAASKELGRNIPKHLNITFPSKSKSKETNKKKNTCFQYFCVCLFFCVPKVLSTGATSVILRLVLVNAADDRGALFAFICTQTTTSASILPLGAVPCIHHHTLIYPLSLPLNLSLLPSPQYVRPVVETAAICSAL